MLLWEGLQSSAPSRPKLVLICTLGQEEQVRVKCLAQGHNTWPTWGSNSWPWDHESRALTLSYTCLFCVVWCFISVWAAPYRNVAIYIPWTSAELSWRQRYCWVSSSAAWLQTHLAGYHHHLLLCRTSPSTMYNGAKSRNGTIDGMFV